MIPPQFKLSPQKRITAEGSYWNPKLWQLVNVESSTYPLIPPT